MPWTQRETILLCVSSVKLLGPKALVYFHEGPKLQNTRPWKVGFQSKSDVQNAKNVSASWKGQAPSKDAGAGTPIPMTKVLCISKRHGGLLTPWNNQLHRRREQKTAKGQISVIANGLSIPPSEWKSHILFYKGMRMIKLSCGSQIPEHTLIINESTHPVCIYTGIKMRLSCVGQRSEPAFI